MAENKECSSSWGTPFSGFATTAIHNGQDPEQWSSMMVVPPITPSTTFKQVSPGVLTDGYDYSRGGNPTRRCLEKCVAGLEGAKYALAYSSGLAATMTIINTLKAGDHVISTDDVYGGTNRYFQKVAAKFGLEFSFVDFTNLDNVKAAIKPNTKILWVETPTNPTMKVTDIRAVADLEKPSECIIVVDNTFMSSYFQRPLLHGADIAYHSATKYMNGHSDVVMGLITTSNDELYKKLQFLQYATGPVPSAFDCYLVNRGIKTLALRMEQHQKNAIKVATWLQGHSGVEKVNYPGLPSHPQYEIMKKQATGCSGMIAFWLKGDLQTAKTFLQSLKVFILAESLGGYESLAEHPAIMTHASVPAAQREVLGIGDNFIRISVGLENVEDLIADLDQAMKLASAGK
nr:cystathionine gamma-lyase isoform X2 [Ciona intestinalis]XP_026691709.1 cystathionine gamma-lyase isoform X1 [Ciona intestinalis]|eukprot:XP_009859544.1 cystathionine gamma-lyase isoform X2 [Ciona intestinalis]